MTAPTPMRAGPRDPIRSDADAVRRLGDLPLVLYAMAQGAKLAWSIITKRWPELGDGRVKQ